MGGAPGDTLVHIVLIIVGLVLIAGSRTFADAFGVPPGPAGRDSGVTKLLGMGSGYKSRLYRWASAMLTGLVLAGVGIFGLLSG